MPSDCEFVLDHPNRVYYSGETINGIINLTTTKDKNIRHVRIVFLGEGKVKWTESSSRSSSNGSSSTRNIYYKSHEIYVNNETYIRGEGTLPLGLHTYTFSITLPLQCPTSCEGKYGHIRYVLSLILDRPLRFNNVYNIPLTILQTVDLNWNPTFKLPFVAERVYSLCHWNCTNGKMIYAVQLPFGAYAPGQEVKYSVCISNQTLADTAGYSLEFIQQMTFTAKLPSRKERHKKKVLAQGGSSEACLRLSNRIFEGHFCIPAVPPTTDSNSIIRVAYTLKVTLLLAGCRHPKILSIPIVIGNIPLRESLSTASHSPAAERSQVNPSAPALELSAMNSTSGMPPSYNDFKPPSYQATVPSDSPFVDDDVDKHHRVVGFRPLYPMYS